MANAREDGVWTRHSEQQLQQEAYQPNRSDHPDRLTEVLDAEPWDRALDFGCGTALWRNFFQSGRYNGLDQNEAMISGARKRFPDDEFYCVPNIVDGTKMPFEDGTFSVIFTSAVLQHSCRADQKSLLPEIRRVLKTGGRLIMFENTYGDWNPGNDDDFSHTQDGWKNLIEPFGFARISCDRDLHAFRAI